MKKIVFIFIVIIFSIDVFSQAPNWTWAKSAGGTSNEGASSISTDAGGNVYVTGNFQSSSITFGSTTLTNASTDSTDIFIVKYDSSGNVLWAQRAGGTNSDGTGNVSTDAMGNVYISGYFNSASITFGSTTLTNAATGTGDIFVVKYDSGGNALWAKRAGGTNYDSGGSVCINAGGNVYLTGTFWSSSIIFGSTTLTNAATGTSDIFVVKYDNSGNALWAKKAGGTNYDSGSGISTVGSNVYVTGSFNSSSITFGSTTLTNAGFSDIFVVKYDSSGNVLWAEKAGGTSSDASSGISTDAGDNFYITGGFASPSVIFGNDTLINAGAADIFVAKYDSGGNALWAKSAGWLANEQSFSIATDAGSSVYITGYFSSDSITFGSTTLTNAGLGSADVFVVKYDSGGNILWAKSAGSAGSDMGSGISTDAGGNVYIAGFFQSSAITFGSTALTNAGGNDIFTAKLSSSIVGIDANNLLETIHIFPNPAASELYVNGYMLNEKSVIEIYDVMGKKVFPSPLSSPFLKERGTRSEVIDVSSLSPGIYFVRVKTDKGISVAKFVKQ